MTWVDVDPNEQRGTWVDVPEPGFLQTPMNYTGSAILKGYTGLAGLPHTIGRGYDALKDYAFGDLTPQDPETLPTMAPAPASWLTRHTLSPETISNKTYGLLSDVSQATGGKPVEPYEATSSLGKIGQATLEAVPGSMPGKVATEVPRILAGTGGGAGAEAFRQQYPDAPWWQQALASVVGGATAERAGAAVTGTTNYARSLLSSEYAKTLQEPVVAAKIAQQAQQPGSLLADTIDTNAAQWTTGARPDLGNVTENTGVRAMVYADQTAAQRAAPAGGAPSPYPPMADATNRAQRAAIEAARPNDAATLLAQAVQGRDAAVGAIAPGVTQQEAGRELRGNLQAVYDQRAGTRAAAGGAPYAALENNPAVVDLTAVRNQTTAQAALHAGEVGKAYQAAADQFTSATGTVHNTASFADSVRKGLSDLEMSYPRGSAAQRAVAQVKDNLDASLKVQVPEIAEATATWAANSKPLDVFKAAPFGGAIQRDRFGERYLMDNDTVAASFLRGNGAADALDRLHGVFGDPESATRGLQDYIAGQVRRSAVKADGSIDAPAMANVLKPFQAAMMRFPSLQRTFATAEGAQAALNQRQAYQSLYDTVETQLGTGVRDTAGNRVYSADKFGKFVNDNGALIDQAYTPAQAATVRRVNEELTNIAQTIPAGKVAGTSGTAQLTPAGQAVSSRLTHAAAGSVLGSAFGMVFGPVGERVGHVVGSTVGLVAGVGSEARKAAFEQVQRTALTDPVYAAALLRKYDPSGVNSPAAVRAMKYVLDRTPTLAALQGTASGAASIPHAAPAP